MHDPVMLDEVLRYLKLEAPLHTQASLRKQAKSKKIIDATLGAGGYTLAFCKSGAEVLSIEQDENMLAIARKRLDNESCPSNLLDGNFADIKVLSEKEQFTDVDGVVFDLGVASEQLTSHERGLSYQNPEADLDMRLDTSTQGVKASDLLNALDKTGLTALFTVTQEEYLARRLVRKVMAARQRAPFKTVGDFLKISSIYKKGKIHPATQALLALRIAVNMELTNLELGLKGALSILKGGGRLVVVSFHSGEDAIVKSTFKRWDEDGLGKVITEKPISPTEKEVFENARSRSAKLRAFEKI